MHVLPRKWREGWRQHARNQAAWPPAITPCASAATNYSAARLVATLLRALRADKLYLAALSATLLHYLRDEALSKIPVCRMISMPKAEIAKKALAAELREGGFDASVIDGQSTVGGGSLPGETLPTKLVAVRHRSPEAQAHAAGVSYESMMELAGTAVAAAVSERMGSMDGVQVLVLVGPGKNGGDGLVAARHLVQAGASVKAYCLKPRAAADPQLMAALAAGVFVVDAESDQRLRVFANVLRGTRVVVDALFGTGARRPMPEIAAQLLRKAHAHILQTPGALNVAVDCPSGYDCDTGEMDRDTMPAALTVTFGAAKFGQVAPGGADVIGDLLVADIGWPADMPALQAIKPQLATAADVCASLPPRPRSAHKGTFGRALVVAGSVNYTGAAYLAAAAAYRIGPNPTVVTVDVRIPIGPIFAPKIRERCRRERSESVKPGETTLPVSSPEAIRGGLDLIAESLLVVGIANMEVVNAADHPDRAIDQFSDDVGVTGVTLRVGGDMHQDLMQRHGIVPPPPHPPGRVQGEVVDRRVRDLPGGSVPLDQAVSGLVRSSPELGRWTRVARPPRLCGARRSPEHITEVREVGRRAVFHQTEQVRARWRHRAPDVVLVETLQLPDQRLAGSAQVVAQLRLHVEVGHRSPQGRSWSRRWHPNTQPERANLLHGRVDDTARSARSLRA